MLLSASWAGIAPASPRSDFRPSDPSDPQYRWEGLDGAVRDAASRGLTVALSVTQAPTWAEGAGRPADAPAGTWRPSSSAFGAFAAAIARRYSGTTVDASGATLPRVRNWQAWGEPNLSVRLGPQWMRQGSRLQPASPAIYRSLLNAFYGGVKGVHADNQVITAGTAPYGDPRPGGARMMPALFVRTLLCVGAGRRPRPQPCSGPAHFDALAHDPYSVWLEEAFYVLWRQGVDTITWYNVRDQAPIPDYGSTYQSGVYLRDGTPKPSARAYRFPLVLERARKGVRVWGMSPASGVVSIQRRKGRRWVGAARFRGRAGATFFKTLRLPRKVTARAVISGQSSLSFTLR
ncbi:MAG: hypothetical protein E6G56_09455 [Actinobacteria bacterium]|nr:MAG: hypothetical protein E6G56_09455 [Actinomycetota bacterium]